MSEDTKAIPDSAPPRDDSGATDGRTQEQLLADIVSNSEFVPNEEQSLPLSKYLRLTQKNQNKKTRRNLMNL